ncbi:hypothetical protein DYB38_012015 [Aphanomyces astaci]|uniref:CULT domain-containing protein n=1 Tax=Aphanomyces astaci TaxID=112090 RepID=A0A397CIN7_APHAT|nr:hypothetical protein DYB38_012015 [Aphanomyces astaci]
MNLVKLSLALSIAAAHGGAHDAPASAGYTTTSDDEAKTTQRDEVALDVEGGVRHHVAASKSSHALVALATTESDVATPDISGVSMRCRFCGAHLAWKHHYQHLPDESKAHAKNTRTETSLGEHGEVVYFDNPAGVEFELASFQHSDGVPSDAYTQQDTFFDSYNWRALACPRCAKHVGYVRQLHKPAVPSGKKGSKTKLAALVDAAFADKSCYAMSNGWWSYQHCYKSDITQFHLEPDGVKANEWSLGHFSDNKSTDTEIAHHFTGGQDIVVDTIEEPSLCTYLMRVCVPQLCQSKPKIPDVLDKKIEKACAQTLVDHQKPTSPSFLPLFYTLVWPDTIAEDSPELTWTHSLSTVTSIIGR